MPQSIRPVPSARWPGRSHFIGFNLGVGEVVAAIVMLFASYAVRRHLRRAASPPRTVIIAVVALNVVVLLGPPLFSTDVFSYQAYARMFTHYHTNPYIHGPTRDPARRDLSLHRARWIYTPSVYGPLFTFISGIFASASIAVSEFAFKLIAALASAGTMYLIWQSRQAARGQSRCAASRCSASTRW